MCMIAHRFLSEKGKGANIPNAVIDTALTRHPDGYGIAWRKSGGKLMYEKFGPGEWRQFRELLKAIDHDQSIEYVAHFRYATHGPEDADHAHPYAYDDPDKSVGKVLVFHNGVVSSMKTTAKESDTEVFVRDYLAHLPSRWWTIAGIRKIVSHVAGWSRLVLMTKDETVNLNWLDGEEDGGLWYSSEHRPSQWGTKAASTTWWNSYDEDEDGTWVRTTDGWRKQTASVTPTTQPRSNTDVFRHEGHALTPLQAFDFTKDGDYECSVICDTCGTAGDVYIADGRAYVDIPHAWDVREDGTVPEADKENALGILPDDTSPKQTALVALPEGDAILVGASGSSYGKGIN